MRSAIALSLLLSACATFPALDGTISQDAADAPFPTLTPLPVAPAAQGDEAAALQARVAALQAKADRIRQIDIAALQ